MQIFRKLNFSNGTKFYWLAHTHVENVIQIGVMEMKFAKLVAQRLKSFCALNARRQLRVAAGLTEACSAHDFASNSTHTHAHAPPLTYAWRAS
jgi:hypothetical protein